MSFKFGKKGKNPGAVDSWLDTLGYYRKNIAYDETCLFRAVSEQLYYSQMHHERIRTECIEFAKGNFDLFSDLIQDEMEWYDHLQKLKIHMVICDNIEIQIISQLYNRDVLVFDGLQMQVRDVTNNKFSESILLCKTNEDHYDAIYKKEYIMTAGFCQSIVYSVLYENVYQIENVSSIVNSMLYDKNTFAFALSNSGLSPEEEHDCVELKKEEIIEKRERSDAEFLLAPFPFKVAKALDPTIYRNIEYDSWIEIRRELRLGEWYNGDNKLILGTRCILRLNGQEFSCYIQDHIKNENKCVVYITSLAEFRTVLYTDLKPEEDAKPWPLPYRFSRNMVLFPPPLQLPGKEQRNAKKRKEKKRNKSCSESSTQSVAAVNNEVGEVNVSVYEGCPLQMKEESKQDLNNSENIPQSQPEQQLLQPEPEVQWMNEWGPISYTPDANVWSQTTNNLPSPHPYGYKPHVVPMYQYQASETPQYYYNYIQDNNNYNPWPSPEVMPSDVNYVTYEVSEEVPLPPQTTPDPYVSSPKCYYYHPSPPYPTAPSPSDKSLVSTPLTPISPAVDYYPLMYHPATPHPTTPVYYISPSPPAQPVTPKIPELMVPLSPLQVFTPPTDVQYMSPTSFVFPASRPASQPGWYSPTPNSQGFIFPAPMSN